jgi:hypothetical protein
VHVFNRTAPCTDTSFIAADTDYRSAVFAVSGTKNGGRC